MARARREGERPDKAGSQKKTTSYVPNPEPVIAPEPSGPGCKGFALKRRRGSGGFLVLRESLAAEDLAGHGPLRNSGT